ncbi:MAG: hypothetical protein Q7S29_02960 [Candidatus Peribacter sp.]|nr:hypothetical protein [Candidatus Peribacter sp.]
MSFTQDPKGYSYSHALLGAAIYGEEDPAIRETLKEEREWQEFKKDTARLKAEIRRKIPTSQEWVAMTGQQKCSFKIAGRGEKAIASALDISVKESPSGNSYSHALLGTAIYGVKDPALQAMLKEEIEWKELKRDPAKLRAEVRRRMPTGQEWMAMTKKEKKFKIAERGENAIANALGVSLEQDPCANPYSHALLGAAIYGEDDPAIQAALRRAKKNEDE